VGVAGRLITLYSVGVSFLDPFSDLGGAFLDSNSASIIMRFQDEARELSLIDARILLEVLLNLKFLSGLFIISFVNLFLSL
jgi:hypothetical protein